MEHRLTINYLNDHLEMIDAELKSIHNNIKQSEDMLQREYKRYEDKKDLYDSLVSARATLAAAQEKLDAATPAVGDVVEPTKKPTWPFRSKRSKGDDLIAVLGELTEDRKDTLQEEPSDYQMSILRIRCKRLAEILLLDPKTDNPKYKMAEQFVRHYFEGLLSEKMVRVITKEVDSIIADKLAGI